MHFKSPGSIYIEIDMMDADGLCYVAFLTLMFFCIAYLANLSLQQRRLYYLVNYVPLSNINTWAEYVNCLASLPGIDE